jgi:hypothetical protein
MDMNKHIASDKNSKPFHSHGYAEVANGNSIGSTSSISFEQRQLIDLNRQLVDNYGRSNIGGLRSVVRPKKATDDYISSNRAKPYRVPERPINSDNTGKIRFIEPPSRSYNPYP